MGFTSLPIKWAGKAAKPLYHTFRQKDTGPAKASPFGRGGTEGDGEGKPGRKEPLRSDGQALCQSDAIAVPELFVSGLALSVSLRSPALPKGEPLPERATVNLWKMHDRKEKNL